MSLSPTAMVLNVIQTADLNLEEAAGELQDFIPDTHILATLGVCALGTSVYVWVCVCVCTKQMSLQRNVNIYSSPSKRSVCRKGMYLRTWPATSTFVWVEAT